jgi:predicted nuclease with RNAse H fold
VSVRSLGVDVGVADGKGLDLVLMDAGRVPFVVVPRAGRADIARIIERWRPAIVAIDAPPRWASSGRSRSTENQLARLNIHSFRTPALEHASGRQFDWMRTGIDVFEHVAGLGYPLATGRPYRGRAIEVFPHATAAVLAGCLAPKGMRKRVWRERVLRMQGVRTEELTTLDQLDAALAALTGLLVLEGHDFAPGDPLEGAIVIPTGAPATKYRPGTNSGNGEAQLFAWCACGSCDRQVPAGRQFAPGHDAKRKSALWRMVRDGREAEEELRRRGWERPPETTD